MKKSWLQIAVTSIFRLLFGPPKPMDRSLLLGQITVEEAEAKHMVVLGGEPVPFGFINSKWRSLLELIQPGDELWEYSTSAESWAKLRGWAGIVLLREGMPVGGITTSLN